MTQRSIVVLDFGSQYTQLIARRIRELGAHSLILPFRATWSEISAHHPAGIILSGGPASVYAPDAPRCAPEVWTSQLPILGICYGLQLLVDTLGGTVENADEHEFGRALVSVDPANGLFRGSSGSETVWMSHGDSVQQLPAGFEIIGRSPQALAAIADPRRRMWAVQFHPEVRHSENGQRILGNFLDLCGIARDWTPESFIEHQVARIREQVGGQGRAICGLSGGVDSTVAATLVHRAIGDRLVCVFVNNGLLRLDEFQRYRTTSAANWASISSPWTPAPPSSPRSPASPTRNRSARSLAGSSSKPSNPKPAACTPTSWCRELSTPT
jgi:GMP synthase (glutamine-hydrolysing)